MWNFVGGLKKEIPMCTLSHVGLTIVGLGVCVFGRPLPTCVRSLRVALRMLFCSADLGCRFQIMKRARDVFGQFRRGAWGGRGLAVALGLRKRDTIPPTPRYRHAKRVQHAANNNLCQFNTNIVLTNSTGIVLT